MTALNIFLSLVGWVDSHRGGLDLIPVSKQLFRALFGLPRLGACPSTPPPLRADSCESALLAALINARATRPFGSIRLKSSQGRIPRSFVRNVFPVLLLCCGSGEQPRHPYGPLVRGIYLAGCERTGLGPSALCCRADGVKYRLTDNVCQQKL